MWGIYYKPDWHFGGIQGGASPYKVDTPVDEVKVDPYGPSSPEFVSSKEFAHMWVSALAHCHKRFEGTMPKYHKDLFYRNWLFYTTVFLFLIILKKMLIIADPNHGK